MAEEKYKMINGKLETIEVAQKIEQKQEELKKLKEQQQEKNENLKNEIDEYLDKNFYKVRRFMNEIDFKLEKDTNYISHDDFIYKKTKKKYRGLKDHYNVQLNSQDVDDIKYTEKDIIEKEEQKMLLKIRNTHKETLFRLKNEQKFISYDLFEIYNWDYNKLGKDLYKIVSFFRSYNNDKEQLIQTVLNNLIPHIRKNNKNITRQELINELFESLLTMVIVLNPEKIIEDFIKENHFENKEAENIRRYFLKRRYFYWFDFSEKVVKRRCVYWFDFSGKVLKKLRLEEILYDKNDQLNDKIMFLINESWSKKIQEEKKTAFNRPNILVFRS